MKPGLRAGAIIVTGSVAFDYLMRFPGRFVEHLIPDRMDRLSVSFLVDEMRRVPGGVGPNIAYGLSLLGERPLLVASAGSDAREYRDHLEREGVDVTGLVLHEDVFTASFFVSTDLDQNQLASFYTGAMARARQLSLAEAVAAGGSLVVVSPNDPEAMARHLEEAEALGIAAVYDPSQQVARLSGGELARGIDAAWMLIANDYEFGILTQKTDLPIEQIESRTTIVVTTHGSKGSTVSVSDGGTRHRHEIPPARCEAPADPTGVGDAYRAGLLRGFRLGLPWSVAGRMGSVAAVFALEAPGPQPPRYSTSEFRARYEANFGPEGLLDALAREGGGPATRG